MADVHKSRVFLWVLLSCIGGVAVRSFVVISYTLIATGFLAASVALVTGFSRKSRRRVVYGLIIASFCIGVVRFDLAIRANLDIASLFGKPVTARGVVWTEPIVGPQSQTLRVRVHLLNGRQTTAPFMLRVVGKRYPAYGVGDALVLHGTMRDSADEIHMQRRMPTQEVSMLFPSIEKTNTPNQRPIMYALVRLKHTFGKSIDTALPEPHAAFLKGLLLGERAALPADLIESFRKTGTSHIVALSGYNITIIGKSLTWLLMMLTIPFSASFWVACSAMILFVVMTGASASAVRAGIIAVLALIADREGRPYQMTHALACAGVSMLMFDPTLLRFDVGFELSFLATMGLVYLSPGIERRVESMFDRFKKLIGMHPASRALQQKSVETTPRIFLAIKHLLVETLAAQLAVLPLLLYLFGDLSIVSPLANIAALIAVPYAMGIGFVTGLAGLVSARLGSVVGVMSWLLLEYVMRVIRWFADFPLASVDLGKSSMFVTLALYGIVVWGMCRKRKTKRYVTHA